MDARQGASAEGVGGRSPSAPASESDSRPVVQMAYRESTDRAGLSRMTARELRETFVIDRLFRPGELSLDYLEVERAVVGSAMPTDAPLLLPTHRELASRFFCERREVGVINIGGPGWISLDGERFDLARHDSLYIGRGVETVAFASKDAAAPARYYFVSYPAHAAYPSRRIRRDEARVIFAGEAGAANRRVIRQAIRPGLVETCQLVMGFTALEDGNVWNTMPPHTHRRRSEIYMYFDAAPGRVMHLMGEPAEPRAVFMDEGEAVFSPSWSIHSGVGTGSYSFVWSMGGENLEFDDMDVLAVSDLGAEG
ncbi:5-dehydro-4-deoxy-D-glucuronate isomerase [uncultured Caulobacter sp.]|uniref:5-dehydro-4-deoxy-D-glucuronate isomerase n=1 Tax=uncultured Caulobacter sp. TaxID=158749 RepID=UPI0026301907|nr:5-dehydro-4-deoxy-D-glucuronate isomerase [uncultured Caulobacter sp.]